MIITRVPFFTYEPRPFPLIVSIGQSFDNQWPLSSRNDQLCQRYVNQRAEKLCNIIDSPQLLQWNLKCRAKSSWEFPTSKLIKVCVRSISSVHKVLIISIIDTRMECNKENCAKNIIVIRRDSMKTIWSWPILIYRQHCQALIHLNPSQYRKSTVKYILQQVQEFYPVPWAGKWELLSLASHLPYFPYSTYFDLVPVFRIKPEVALNQEIICGSNSIP